MNVMKTPVSGSRWGLFGMCQAVCESLAVGGFVQYTCRIVMFVEEVVMRGSTFGGLLLLGLLVLLGLTACSGEGRAVALDELLALPEDQLALLFFYTDN